MWVRKNSNTVQDCLIFFSFLFFLRGSTDDLFSGSTGHSVLKVETCFTSLTMEKSPIVRCICHLKHKCLMDGNDFKAGWMVLVLLVEHLAAAQIKRGRAPVWVPEKKWRKPQPHLCFGFLFLFFFDVWLTKWKKGGGRILSTDGAGLGSGMQRSITRSQAMI